MLNMATIRRRRLMSGGASLSAYAVGGNEPDVVADFASATEYFRVGGSDTTFASMFDLGTTTAYPTSLRTMFDSDGLLKWGPHNVNSYSTDLTNAGYLTFSSVTVDDASTVSFGAYSTGQVYKNLTLTANAQYTFAIEVSCASGTESVRLKMQDSADDNYSSDLSVTTTPTIISYTHTPDQASVTIGIVNATDASARTLTISKIHVYRSDLGGMVSVPTDQQVDSCATYVPTTTAARYLHRRGNHVYNGSSWVKKGIQIETEARTNLVVNSLSLAGLSAQNTGTVSASATAAPFGSGATVKRVQGAAANDGAKISFTAGSAVNHCCSYYARSRTGVAQDVKVGISGDTGPTFTLPADGTWTLVYNFALVGAGARDSRILQVSGNIDIDVALPQAEAGSDPSSHIPTSGATVTRTADALTIPAANMSYSATAMSFQMDGTVNLWDENQSSGPHLYEWYSSNNEQIYHFLDADRGTGGVSTTRITSGTNDTVESNGSTYAPGANVAFNHAVRMNATTINLAVEGTASTENATASAMPGVSAQAFKFGRILNGAGSKFIGNIGQFRQWDVDLGDANLETATS